MRPSFVTFISLILALLTAGCNKAPEFTGSFPTTKLTDRVYVIHGSTETPNATNQGFINNPGFVLTKNGVVVIDPGSSVQIGEMVLKAISAVTNDPVVAVFNTHIHGDHWLANDAIRRAYPKAVIYAHPSMIRDAPTEGENWLRVMDKLTDRATRGTKLVLPSLALEHDETLLLGGVHFRVLHNGTAHTDGDLMIQVVEEKVLFTGDIVSNERVGRFDETDLKGAISACDMALSVPVTVVVPGHGQSGAKEIVHNYRHWLMRLYSGVQKLYKQGVRESELKSKMLVELKDYTHWKNFDQEIGKILSIVWLQVEKESF